MGIPPAPRGVPQIEVAFDIDANGIVHVSAKDLGTGKQQSIRIVASSGLTEHEIQKMIADAEHHKSADKKKKELADVKNSADGLIYTTEKALEEYADASARQGHGGDPRRPGSAQGGGRTAKSCRGSRPRSSGWKAPPTASPTRSIRPGDAGDKKAAAEELTLLPGGVKD